MNDSKLKQTVAQLLKDLKSIRDLRDTTINMMVENELNKICGISSDVNEKNANDTGFSEAMKLKIATKGNKSLYTIQTLYNNVYNSMLNNVISLNKLLEKPNKKLLEIDQIRQKEFITAKEFEILYGYSVQWQTQKRSNIHYPLPIVSEKNKKILYNAIEVKKWLDNNVFR
jgi:hypothetical protein